MKQRSMLLFTVLCWITLNLNAQTQTDDYFVGKWELMIEGVPGGGVVTGLMNLERKNGKLEGNVIDLQEKTEFKIFKVLESENRIKLYFNTEDYGEIEYNLEKTDDHNLKGNSMDFLFIKGKRVLD